MAAKFREAADKVNWPGRYLFQMGVNGGTTDAVLVVPAENWAGFAPGAKTVADVLVEAYGEEEARAQQQQFATSIRSQTSYTLRIRPDLSLP